MKVNLHELSGFEFLHHYNILDTVGILTLVWKFFTMEGYAQQKPAIKCHEKRKIVSKCDTAADNEPD